MVRLHAISEYSECKVLWERHIKQEILTDLWDVRDCFHRAFQRDLFFVIAEHEGNVVGFLPLCKIPETNSYGIFPGESWHGKTWLEQNRIIAESDAVLSAMIDFVNSQGAETYHLRYFLPPDTDTVSLPEIDETGYLFTPEKYNYSMDEYWRLFSPKSAKRIKKDVESIYQRGVSFIHDRLEDFEELVHLNVSRFGSDSYFSDERFAQGFRNLRDFLANNGFMRITTVLVNGEIAAVDLGAMYNNMYTLLAGGTSASVPGIAKLINLHHMEYSCERQFREADFLCGEFSWKTMFHLEARPLYKISNTDESVFEQAHHAHQEAVCAAQGILTSAQ